MLFSKPEPIVHPVQGEDQNFYPVSLSVLLSLRGAAKPIGRAFAVLFGGDEDSTKREIFEKQSKATESYEKRTSVEAISPELSKQRQQARMDAVGDLIDGLTSEPASKLLAMVIADSMRDAFEKKPTTAKDYDEILQEITGEMLIDIIGGIAKANRKLFGPLMDRAAQFGTVLKSRLDQSLPDDEAQPAASKSA